MVEEKEDPDGRESGSRGSLLAAPTPFYNEALFARRKDTSADTTYTPRLFGAIDTPGFYSLSLSLSISLSLSFHHTLFTSQSTFSTMLSSRSFSFSRLLPSLHLSRRYQRTARHKRFTKILHFSQPRGDAYRRPPSIKQLSPPPPIDSAYAGSCRRAVPLVSREYAYTRNDVNVNERLGVNRNVVFLSVSVV